MADDTPTPNTEAKAKPKLMPCPCGEVPDGLMIELGGERAKTGYVTGSCCFGWRIEFLNQYEPDQEAQLIKARKAWNEAPRG